MQKIIIINEDQFGWEYFKDENSEIWFKGHNYNTFLKDLFAKIKNQDQNGIKKLLRELDGNFSFIYQDQKFVCASVDRVASIPIFYFIKNNDIIISPKTYLLDNLIDFKDINNTSLLAIKMSGYTIGNNTLYIII